MDLFGLTQKAIGEGYLLTSGVRTTKNVVAAGSSAGPNFYVTPDGTAIPATAYRAISRYPISGIMSTKDTYFTFDDISNMSSSHIRSALQLKYPPQYVAKFNTLQIIDDIRIPYGNWNTQVGSFEPLTASYPKYGTGGFTQAITNSPISNYYLYQVPSFNYSVLAYPGYPLSR